MTELTEEFETVAANGRPIRGDAWIVPNADVAVVLCHGFKGFARWGFFPWLAGQMADAGFTTIAFDFSGSGVGPDRQSFSEPEAFADQTFSEGVDDLDRVMHETRARGWLDSTCRAVRILSGRWDRCSRSGPRSTNRRVGHVVFDIHGQAMERRRDRGVEVARPCGNQECTNGPGLSGVHGHSR